MSPENLKAKGKRLSTPRVKSGCTTCRIRRVKCDEAKPSCQRCVQTGRMCDGYTTMTPASRPSSALSATSSRPTPLPFSIASYAIPFRVPGSQRDRQLLHYFCVSAGGDMSGYLGADSSPFWSRTVLRASHEEPAVRQAVVALSSLHLWYCVEGEGSERNEEALRRYGTALAALGRRIGGAREGNGGTERAVMICCVLFYCFESALGESDGAVKHLENGLRVLNSVRERRSRDLGGVGVGKSEGESDVAEMLARLDLQATMFDDNRAPSLSLVSLCYREQGIPEIRNVDAGEGSPGSFSSIGAAQTALSKLQNWLFRLLAETLDYKGLPLEDIPLPILEEKSRLARDYSRWGAMFDSFLAQQTAPAAGVQSGVRILGVHHRLTQMLLESNLPDDAAFFGAETNVEAGALLDVIEEVIRTDGKDGATRRSFSSETGVVAPLFLLAVKCADEVVAGRAAKLLGRCRRREGLYDAEVVGAVLGRLQAVREEKMRIIGGGCEEVSGYSKGKVAVSLEVWGEEMIDSRAGGVDAIGEGLSVP